MKQQTLSMTDAISTAKMLSEALPLSLIHI